MNYLKGFTELCRVSNLPTVWTNVLAAVVLSHTPFPWSSFLVLIFSISLYYSGGMCLNDLCDVAADRIHKPLRPIPSGRVSVRGAATFTVVLLAAAWFLLFLVPRQSTLYPGLVLLGLIVFYDWVHKNHPLSILLMAGCRLMVFIVSGVAVSGTVGRLVALGGIAQFIYILLLSLAARKEQSLGFSFPLIPVLLAGISLLDGIVLAVLVAPVWLVAGMGGAALTHFGQRFVRGD